MKAIAAIIGLILLVGSVMALPTPGVATGINSNGFNSTITGVTGSDCWIMFGDGSGKENWASVNGTAVAGTAAIQVIGAPIYGGENIYFIACDLTGCGALERTVTIPAITPMTTTTYGQFVRNITNARFNPSVISQSMYNSYNTVAPFTVLIGIMLFMYMIGIWMRSKSVRLITIVGVLIAPFVILGNNGLYLGVPEIGVLLVKGLLAAGLAGILFAFARK